MIWPQACSASNLNMTSSAALGNNVTATVTLYKNNTATALTCTIPNSGSVCTSAGSVAVAANDLLSYRMTTSGNVGAQMLYVTMSCQ